LQDAPGVATKMKNEITYKPQNDATFGEQSGPHADFTYSISGNVISITDLNLGNRLVTNDAETVFAQDRALSPSLNLWL
jgi:hypothetical protein